MHSAINMGPYQVMFGGRMPYMSYENWLAVDKRRTATLQNKGGEEDNEDSTIL